LGSIGLVLSSSPVVVVVVDLAAHFHHQFVITGYQLQFQNLLTVLILSHSFDLDGCL